MGICSCLSAELAACVLKLVNSILITVGLLLAVIGALVYFGGSFVFDLFSGILAAASGAAGSIGGLDRLLKFDDLQKIMGSWASVIGYAGLLLLIVGLFLVALGVLGWVASCCRLKVAILSYTIIMGVFTVLVGVAAVAMLVARPNVQNWGETEMKKLVSEHYQGSTRDDRNDFTQILDIFQARVGCCGVSNYTDFYSASQWNRNYYLESENRNVTLVTPIACCQLKDTDFTPKYPNCTYAPSDSTSNWRQACYTKIWDMMGPVTSTIVTALAIAAGVTGIVTIFSFIVLRHHIKNDVTPV